MNALLILIISFLIPDELSIDIGGLAINAYRAVLIAVFPGLIWSLFTKANKIDWNVCDILALTLSLWPSLAFMVNTSISTGIESGGVLALEMLVPYFVVRLNVTSYYRRKQLAKYLLGMITVLFLLGLPESIWGKHFTHEIAWNILGKSYENVPDQRFGIYRALGPTNHSILFGTLCVSFLMLAVAIAKRDKRFWIFAIFSVGGGILSASSAPILSILVQLSLLCWATLLRGYKYKWWLLAFLFIALYVTIDVMSNRDPIRVMFSYLLLNSQTGYTRYYMWLNSFEVISQSSMGMIFGYGYDTSMFEVLDGIAASYWGRLMSVTVDSYWLVLMLRYGLTMICLFAVFLVLVFKRAHIATRSLSKRKDRTLMRAYIVVAFTLTLIATTVHFWSEMSCLYMMILAVCCGVIGTRKTKGRNNSTSSTRTHRAHRRKRLDRSLPNQMT